MALRAGERRIDTTGGKISDQPECIAVTLDLARFAAPDFLEWEPPNTFVFHLPGGDVRYRVEGAADADGLYHCSKLPAIITPAKEDARP